MRKMFALGMILLLFMCGCYNKSERYAEFLESGKKYLEQGDVSRAVVEFRNAVQIDPSKPEAYRMLGVATFKLGYYRVAFKNFQLALEKDPDDYMSHYYLARLYLMAGKLDEARKEFEFLKKFPDRPETKFIEALIALKEKKYDEALRALHALRKKLGEMQSADPDLVYETYFMLATLYRKAGNLEFASELLKEAVSKLPAEWDRRKLLELLMLELDNVLSGGNEVAQRALALFDSTVENELYRRNPSLFRQIALGVYKILAMAGDYGSAMKVLEKSYELTRDYRFVELTADLLLKEGKTREAKKVLEDYIEENQDSPDVYKAMFLLAKLEYMNGNREKSKEILAKVLEKNSSYVPALVLMGKIQAEDGNCKDAVTYFNTAFHASPENIEAFTGLLKCYLEQNNEVMVEYVLSHLAKHKSPVLVVKTVQLVSSHPNARKVVLENFMRILRNELYEEKTNFSFIDSLVVGIVRLAGNDKSVVEELLKELELASRRGNGTFFRYEMAKVKYLSGNCDGAYEDLMALVSSDVINVESLVLLGQVMNTCGKDKIAKLEEEWEKAHPVHVGIILAQYYLEKGDYRRSYEIYKQIVDKVRSLIVFNNYASLVAEYGTREEIKHARDKLAKAIALMDVVRPEFLDTLAWLEYKLGRCRNAYALLNLLDNDLQNSMLTVKYHKATVLICIGQKREGLKLLREVIESGKNFPGREDALELLKQLEQAKDK